MIIESNAYARAGLIGNPSDGYFGKTISIILRNFSADLVCYESPRIGIVPRRRDRLEFDSLDALVDDVRMNGYYGGIRLIKASIKRFYDYCAAHSITLPQRNFTIEYETNIPVRVGLAGSSAIITSTIRALCRFFEVKINKPFLPNLILSVELEELGIGAGLQDRVIQVYEGVVYMDFDRDLMERQGHGRYEPLDADKLPPLFVAYHDNLAEGTEVTHNDLRSRFNRQDKKVLSAVSRWAQLAQDARDQIQAGNGDTIGPLMEENFELRNELIGISNGNRRLIEVGRRHGASCKFAGSGGAVIGTYDGDPDRLQRITTEYRSIQTNLVVPIIS